MRNALAKNLASGKNRAVLTCLDVTELNSMWLRPSKQELSQEANDSKTCTNASLGPPFLLQWQRRWELPCESFQLLQASFPAAAMSPHRFFPVHELGNLTTD